MKRIIGVFAMAIAMVFLFRFSNPVQAYACDCDSLVFKSGDEVSYITEELMAPEVEVYDSSEWSEEFSESLDRDGKLVFVREVSTVIDGEAGDGETKDGFYVAYKPGQFEDGDTVLTYLLLNPANRYFDDFIARWDEVIEDEEVFEEEVFE